MSPTSALITAPTTAPSRTSVDFRAAIHPSRGWILGLGAGDTTTRVDLLSGPSARALASDALTAECVCPDLCERDHESD